MCTKPCLSTFDILYMFIQDDLFLRLFSAFLSKRNAICSCLPGTLQSGKFTAAISRAGACPCNAILSYYYKLGGGAEVMCSPPFYATWLHKAC